MKLSLESRQALGKYLKEARVQAKLPQSAIVKTLGLKSNQYVSNIERGLCSPSVAFLVEATKAYKIRRPTMASIMKKIYSHEIDKAFKCKP